MSVLGEPRRGIALLALLTLRLASGAPAQTVAPGTREIWQLSFGSLPVGDFPKRNDLHTQSSLEIVDHNGVHMLMAGIPASDFVIDLPENLPDTFTLELDVVSQECCGTDDLSFETAKSDPNHTSARITWSPAHQSVSGGGGSGFTATTTMTGGQLAHIIVSVEGSTIKAYTDNVRLYTVSGYRLARGQALRVWLNGSDEKKGAVYLARVRVAEGAATVTQIADNSTGSGVGSGSTGGGTTGGGSTSGGSTGGGSGGSGGSSSGGTAVVQGVTAKVEGLITGGQATVSWQPVQGATSYVVTRWLVRDPTCCNNFSSPAGMSSPQWQDALPYQMGVYGYRVYAYTPSRIYVGETTVQWPSPLFTVAQTSISSPPRGPLGVLIGWGAFPNASAYRVYRKSDPSKPGSELLGTVGAGSSALTGGNEGLGAALDAELSGDVSKFQYWVQAVLADGTTSDPGPVTAVTNNGGGTLSFNPFAGPLAPTGAAATVGGTTTITFNGQQLPGSKVTWTWDQDVSVVPIYLYFANIDIASPGTSGFGAAWQSFRSVAIGIPGTPPIPYLKTPDVVGTTYTAEIPSGFLVRFCVSYFPLTPDLVSQLQDSPACVIKPVP